MVCAFPFILGHIVVSSHLKIRKKAVARPVVVILMTWKLIKVLQYLILQP